jgi:hypothetical protein
VHLLQPVGHLLEAFAQALLQRGVQLLVDGGAHLLELLLVALLQRATHAVAGTAQVQHRFGHHRAAGTGGHAGHDGVVGSQLQHARGPQAVGGQPVFQQPPVRTALRKGHQAAAAQVGRTAHGRGIGGGDEQQRLGKHRARGEARRGEGFGHERGLDLVTFDLTHQRGAGAGAQFQLHVGMPGVKVGQHPWQPRAGRAFQRPQPQRPLHATAAQGMLGVVGHAQQAFGVGQQHLAFVGQHDAPALAAEQGQAQPLFQLLDARGDVGRHPVQPRRRAHHAAFARHAGEDVQRVQVKGSHAENIRSRSFSCHDSAAWGPMAA